MTARDGKVAEVPTHPAGPGVVDMTGAGDAFAAGTRFALARDGSCAEAARLGALCASGAVLNFGAHPEANLAGPAEAEGLPTGGGPHRRRRAEPER